MTVVCIADQRELAWEVNTLQIRSGEDLTVFMGLVLDVGATQVVGDNRYQSNITFPASERTNSTIRTIVCRAGPSVFLLEDGETVTFSVYGEFTITSDVGWCVLWSLLTQGNSWAVHKTTPEFSTQFRVPYMILYCYIACL